MKRIAVLIVLASCLSALWGQESVLGLKDLPALVLKADSSYASAEKAAEYALHDSRASTDKALPQIDLSNQYSLGYNPVTQKSITIPPAVDVTLNDATMQSLKSNLSVSQMLPTAGSLSLNLGNTMSVTGYGAIDPALAASFLDPNAAPQFKQSPSLSLSLNQPILLNGKLIDMDLFPATLRTASLGYEKAECARRAQSNQTLLQAAQLFIQVVQMRKSVVQSEKAISVAQRNLDNLDKSYSLGSVAEVDLLDQKIAFADRKSALLDLKMSLNKGERALAHSLGRESLDGVALADEIPSIPPVNGDLASRAMANHPLIQQQVLAAEEKRLLGVISGQKYASNLSLGFSFAPKYPGLSETSGMDFGTSFSRLFESGWEQDFGFSIGLTLHLFDGGQGGESRAANDALAASAELQLAAQRYSVRDQLEQDMLKKANLEERIPVLEIAVDLAKRRLDVEAGLLALGRTTELKVDEKRVDHETKQNDLWKAQADLAYVTLELSSLAGDDIAQIMQGTTK